MSRMCHFNRKPLCGFEQNAMEDVGKLVEERTAYRVEDQLDLETEVLNRRTEREKAEDEEKLQEVTPSPTAPD